MYGMIFFQIFSRGTSLHNICIIFYSQKAKTLLSIAKAPRGTSMNAVTDIFRKILLDRGKAIQ